MSKPQLPGFAVMASRERRQDAQLDKLDAPVPTEGRRVDVVGIILFAAAVYAAGATFVATLDRVLR